MPSDDHGTIGAPGDIQENPRQDCQRTRLYFAHPCRSCGRGTNGNHNGMIRRSIPKGSDIGLRSEQEVRKLLGGKTPLGRLKAGMGEGLTAPPFLEPPPR